MMQVARRRSPETNKPTVWVATVGMPFPSFLVASSLYAVSNFLECLDEVLVGAFLGVIYYCHCLVGNGCFNLPDTLDKTYVALDFLLAVWTGVVVTCRVSADFAFCAKAVLEAMANAMVMMVFFIVCCY